MRVIFMGTPDFAVPVLSEIVGHGHEVVAVYSRAPKPAGRRGLELTPSPVHRAAEGFGLPVLTPTSLRTEEAAATFAVHGADVAVVVAYGLILPKVILDAPVDGCLNLHGSLLPRWRGAAPLQRAIMAGDTETGVMVMRMEAGLDTGPVAMVEKLAITPDMTTGVLHDAMARIGADLMVRALAALSRGALTFQPQPQEGVVYAHKIDKQESRIDWSLSAGEIYNRWRGLSPFPGMFFETDFGAGPERVKVLEAHPVAAAGPVGSGPAGSLLDDALTIACGEGALRLAKVQRAGRGAVSGQEFLSGARWAIGHRL